MRCDLPRHQLHIRNWTILRRLAQFVWRFHSRIALGGRKVKRRRPKPAFSALAVSIFVLCAVAHPYRSWGASSSDEVAGFDSQSSTSVLDRLKRNSLGSFYLKLRPRYEYAKTDGLDSSNPVTLRVLTGFGSKTWNGLSLLAEGEAVVVFNPNSTFDGIGPANGRSLVADPSELDLNQLYFHFDHPEWNTNFQVGRQRLNFEDARFIGNVGWRQNEQTFDAAQFNTDLGFPRINLSYTHIWQALRIFGQGGRGPAADFDSRIHAVRLSYSGGRKGRLTAFAYLFDIKNSRQNSSKHVRMEIRPRLRSFAVVDCQFDRVPCRANGPTRVFKPL